MPASGQLIRLNAHRYDVQSVEVSYCSDETLAAEGAVVDVQLRSEGRTWDNVGRVEDVATGSAAGPVAGYLLHHRVRPGGKPLLIHQGQFIGRPSTIEVRPDADARLWVGGPVAPVAAGRFHARLS